MMLVRLTAVVARQTIDDFITRTQANCPHAEDINEK